MILDGATWRLVLSAEWMKGKKIVGVFCLGTKKLRLVFEDGTVAKIDAIRPSGGIAGAMRLSVTKATDDVIRRYRLAMQDLAKESDERGRHHQQIEDHAREVLECLE